MAVTAKLKTSHGEERDLYVRVNSISTNNHREISLVLFRGFLSKETFQSGASYMWEKELEMHLDVSAPLWPQAYDELKILPEFVDATDC
jgi:hypothetical protein